MPQTFNFYEFLKSATIDSLAPLQNNTRYDDVVSAIANMFEKLYLRAQEVQISNSMDLSGSNDFQKYLNTNDGTVVVDFILEYLSKYLDTDHFKDTIALLIRQFKEREIDGEIPDLNVFITNHIIPSFKFFTLNAGDLHKSKGVRGLIERIFEFYSSVDDYEKMFDGIVEWDTEDPQGKRISNFTSYRMNVSEDILLSNHSSLSNLIIKNYIELSIHKLVHAGNYVFISNKERDDWHLLDSMVDNIFKIDDDYFAVLQTNTLVFYKDDVSIYDSNYEFVTPSPELTYENVEWVPKIINIKDPLNQYHKHNLYFIEKIENSDTLSDFDYNLIRFYNDVESDRRIFQTIKTGLGLSYDPLSYSGRTIYPKITEYVSFDYLWLDFYDVENDTSYEFNNEDVKLVYSYVINYQTKQPDDLGDFIYPINKLLVLARDGYNYQPSLNGYYYNIIESLTDETYNKYILQERLMTSLLEEELKRISSNQTHSVRTVFDIFIPTNRQVNEDNHYTFRGYWDASSDSLPTTGIKNHGDYYIVSKLGDYVLNGISNWNVNDIVVWNDKLEYWEKNNEISSLTNENKSYFKISRTLVVLDTPEFDNDDDYLGTPYEQTCGMNFIKISDIDLDIDSCSKIISSDTNPIERFGENPFVLFSFKSATDNRYKIMFIPMDIFDSKVIVGDISRTLFRYPFKNSSLTIYDVQFTDKHIIVYGSDSNNTSIGRFSIILENAGYNLPLGIRSNNMNIQYDVDLRTTTRSYQPYYRISDDNGDEITDEEVSAFRATLKRYTPINVESDSFAARIDMGYTNQSIKTEDQPEEISVNIPSLDTSKTLKEQSNQKMQSSLSISVLGDPTEVNCDCSRQREVLYVYDFDVMKIYYDIINLIPDPRIIGDPYKVEVYKKDRTRDKYSRYQDVCRWESDWFEYQYDDSNTLLTRVRTKIRLNLYDKYQNFVPWGSNGILTYNWGMHFLVQYLVDDPYTTVEEWIDAIDEEIYKNSVLYDECNPIGQFYTTNVIDNGSTFPMIIINEGTTLEEIIPDTLRDPWNVYDIPAAKVSLT